MKSPIRVLLADDHARTRAMVRTALELRGDFQVCAEAADAEAAVLAAESEEPDVCLLDINMPGSGIAAAARITAALPATAVVMLTVSRQDEDLFDALRGGRRVICSRASTRTASGTRCTGCSTGRRRSPGASSHASSRSSAIASTTGSPSRRARLPASPGGNGTCWS